MEIEKACNIYAFLSEDNEGWMKCILTNEHIVKLLHVKWNSGIGRTLCSFL